MARIGAHTATGRAGRSIDVRSTTGRTSPVNATNDATERREAPVDAVQTGLPARIASTAINAGPASRTVVRDVENRIVIGAIV